MFYALKHIMRDGKIVEPGTELADLNSAEVENLLREKCIETTAARDARKRVEEIRSKAQRDADELIANAERDAVASLELAAEAVAAAPAEPKPRKHKQAS